MNKYKFNFSDLKILQINFSVNQSFEIPKQDTSVEIGSKLNIGHRVDGNNLHVFMKLELDNTHVPFDLMVECAGLFIFDQGLDGNENNFISELSNINCAAIIFPYLRETIADITRRAGFPPLHLPPVNFVEIYKRSKAQGNTTAATQGCKV
jgi:preprotein translocase subunit SecB